MNVLVLPSAQPEPLGDVMLEAMAMGVPVIATNIGGPPEVVVGGTTGFLVPPSDPEALADKIELLMNDPKLWAFARDKRGRARVTERFSIAEMVAKIEALYGIICAARESIPHRNMTDEPKVFLSSARRWLCGAD